MISADIDEIIDRVPSLRPYARSLAGRSMLSQKATVFPAVFGFLAYVSVSLPARR